LDPETLDAADRALSLAACPTPLPGPCNDSDPVTGATPPAPPVMTPTPDEPCAPVEGAGGSGSIGVAVGSELQPGSNAKAAHKGIQRLMAPFCHRTREGR
jgi:hypothetical protein